METDEQFHERAGFLHERRNDVIAEEYIEGRELYVSVIGNHRLQVFPIRELIFREVPPDSRRSPPTTRNGTRPIANAGVWKTGMPKDWSRRWSRHIEAVCKRIYHLLTIDGYARRPAAQPRMNFTSSRPTQIRFSPRTKISRSPP